MKREKRTDQVWFYAQTVSNNNSIMRMAVTVDRRCVQLFKIDIIFHSALMLLQWIQWPKHHTTYISWHLHKRINIVLCASCIRTGFGKKKINEIMADV